ncbi:MAG: DNA (cytosine-5-)-methyltransferase [Mycoplasmatales bacterium]
MSVKKLRVFETFAGIGAQHKALERIGIPYEVVATSEWDIDAIICYDAIHHDKINNLDKTYDELVGSPTSAYEFLSRFTFSSDGKVPICNIIKLSEKKAKRLCIAFVRNKNVGSIVDVDPINIPNHDILTYSFPCQDLSVASMGRGKGMGRDAKSRSGLLWEVERILLGLNEQKRLPKYLLLENVTAMLSEQNKPDFDMWVKELTKLGYSTKYYKLNALDFGVPQGRTRVFAISILNDKNTITQDMIESYTKDIRIIHNNELNKKLRNNEIDKKEYDAFKKNQRLHLENILKEGSKYKDELKLAQPNHTPSRIKMRLENHQLEDKKHTYTRTLTTKQDRHPNGGMIKYNNELKDTPFRFLTPRECYMLMGFDSSDFSKVKIEFNNEFTRKEKLYQQAGNSIVVNILESIFIAVWKNENSKEIKWKN